jgi:hypothetical protein
VKSSNGAASKYYWRILFDSNTFNFHSFKHIKHPNTYLNHYFSTLSFPFYLLFYDENLETFKNII